jgi:hypothetical protein
MVFQELAASLTPSLNEAVKKIAADLNANKGAALVVCGSNDPAVQTIVNAINNAIGAVGTTLSFGTVNKTKQGSDSDMNAFVAALKEWTSRWCYVLRLQSSLRSCRRRSHKRKIRFIEVVLVIQ